MPESLRLHIRLYGLEESALDLVVLLLYDAK